MVFSMPRIFRPLVLLSLAATLSLASCGGKPVVTDNPALDADLVILGDGSTVDARPGTLSRAVADWLTAGSTETAYFDLGADAFVPGTAQMSPQGLGRAADLGTLLLSAPDVQLRLSVATNAAGGLPTERAATLARFLEERGLDTHEVDLTPTTASGAPGDAPSSSSLQFQLLRPASQAVHASMQ